MFHNDKNNPFKYYDPRGLGCYKNLQVSDHVIIPTTDDGAWEHFKQYRWTYNKLDVALSQNINCGPVGVKPKNFPIFMKPIFNLYGAGVGSRIIKSEEAYDKNKHLSGYFWMEYLEGEQLSHDIIVVSGEIVYFITFKGHTLGQGMFDYWETVEIPNNIFDHIVSWIKKNLSLYTGCVNIETIGEKIIECHLRMGDIDRLGNLGLMQNIVDIYAGKPWNFYEKLPKFYLFVLWGDWNVSYTIDKDIANYICKDLTCYQIDKPELYFQNPPGGVRVAIICSYNKNDCIKSRYMLYEKFQPRPRKPKLEYKYERVLI